MKTNIGIDDTNRKEIAAILAKGLADEYLLLVKTKNYHWNITGPHFNELHKFFDQQYEELNEITDEIAERIRSLGEKTPASLKAFLELTELSENNEENISWERMIQNLLSDHETLIQTMRTDLETCAEKHKDAGTSDFLTELMQKHEKMAWMLRSFLE